MDPTNNIATDLFYKIRSRFSGLKLGSANGTVTINPEEARFFDFDYKDGDLPIGHVSISLSEENSMKVYFSTGITESMNPVQKQSWYGFLKELRLFAKRRLLAFDTRDIAKDNLDKRDYTFLSQNSSINKPSVGESVMNESQLYGTRTMSFQKLMDTRLIIKHSKTLEDDMQPGARSRNISALFVENQDGERFKYPFIHLAGARAMQRHVANGGVPYDDVGKSIIGMSEEIAQLKSFGAYVVRNDLMNSDTNDIVEQSQQALEQLRERIARLSKQSYYEQYKESFESRQPLEVPQSVVEDYKDKFTVKSFKEELESVFPILYRLMKENNSVDYEDIVSMTTENTNDEADVDLVEEEDEFAKFEQWVMNLGEESPIASEDEEVKAQALKELQELVKEPFPVGVDGTNAIESLKGIIEDPQLYKGIKETAKADPEADLRGAIQQYLQLYAPDVLEQLDFGDFDPNAQAGAEEPQMAGDDPDERNKKDDKDDLPFDADDDASDTDEFGNKIKHRAKHLAKKGMKKAMDVKEVAEFINSFYDRNTGTFPKGPEGVCTMVGKKFGEQAEMVARKFVERMAPHQEQGAEELAELGRMRELAGVKSAAQEQISNEEKIDWESDDVETVKAMGQEFYIKDTPEGKLLLGDDVEGYFYANHNGAEREGHITFVYNIDTGKFLEFPKDYSDFYGYLDHDEVEDYVKELVDEIKGKMSSNEESVSPELEELGRIRELSGLQTEGDIDVKDVPQFKDYGPGPNPELEDKLTKILKRFEDNALERYHYGDVSDKLIQKVAALIQQGETDDAVQAVSDVFGDKDGDAPDAIDDLFEYLRDEFEELADMFAESVNTESDVSESQDDIYTIDNPDLEKDEITGREEPDQIEVKVEFSSYVDEFEIDKVVRVDTGEDITDKVLKDRKLHFSLVHDVQQREQEKADRDYSEDSDKELDRIRKLSGIAQGLGY